MKIFAWIVLALIALVILCLIYYLCVGAIIFKFVFSRRNISSRALSKNISKKLEQYKVDLGWWSKIKTLNCTVQSFDNLKLNGTYIAANSNATVIVFHGFGGSHEEMQPYCKFFYEKNFNVLAVDMRAHARSEGNLIGYGWLEKEDVKTWVNFVKVKTPESKILLFGLSMGAASVLMASGEKDLSVEGIISDCAFDNADRQISLVIKKKKLPKILKKHVYSYAKRLYNFDIKNADAIKQVKNSKTPILFIHGQNDNYVPIENLNNLYACAPNFLKEKFVVESADHAMSYAVAGALY